ncbi:MAG: beta-ketoacyl-[acyl-carrier-protein] synthase family protein [Planctomycetota bacterium]
MKGLRLGIASPDIVITGAGLATSLGVGREASWAALRAGAVGLGPLTAIEDPAQADRGGGEVPPEAGVWPRDEEPREAALLRFAIDEALTHAGLDPAAPDAWPVAPERCGLMLGTTLHGMTAGGRMVRSGSAEPLRDFLAPAVAARAAAHLPLEGFHATTCSACSSGLGSMLLGATLLRTGQLDLVVAGGYDPISEYAYAGFNSLRLVTDRPPRPFARDRDGMKVSEGYAVVVLERADDAEERGQTPFISLRGGGESADAHHLTQPVSDGSGAARAIAGALGDADVTPDNVDLVVAHATGTPDNDAAEVAALSSVLGQRMDRAPVVGLKSRLGHTLGAAGAAELIFAGLALRDGVLPTTATTTPADVDFAPFRLAAGDAQPAELHTSVNTSLGFGGANTCVVVSTPPKHVSTAAESKTSLREVCVTGAGVVLPGVVGHEALRDHLEQRGSATTGPVADDDFLHLLSARRVRRLSDYVKLTLAAASLALDDAGLGEDDDHREAFTRDCPAVLGTAHGSTHYSYDYYRGLVDDGLAAANPLLFAEGVPNAGAAHLSMSLRLRGACQTIIGSRSAGLDALRLASLRIAEGRWDRAVVCAGEEHDELVERCYAELGLPMATCAGAVSLVVEGRAAAEARGARVLGVVESGAQMNYNRRVARGVDRLRRMLEREAGAGMEVVLDSANGTWTDRLEAAAMRRLDGSVKRSTLSGSVAECFSTGPLVAVAAALIGAGLDGQTPDDVRRVGVLGSDFNGLTAFTSIFKPKY